MVLPGLSQLLENLNQSIANNYNDQTRKLSSTITSSAALLTASPAGSLTSASSNNYDDTTYSSSTIFLSGNSEKSVSSTLTSSISSTAATLLSTATATVTSTTTTTVTTITSTSISTFPPNDTLPSHYASDFILSNNIVQITFSILYFSIFILGVFGNVLVCYVVFRNKAMQTVTNLFITNLALSDILLCVLAVPFTPSYTFLGRWVFGKPLCHLVPYAQAGSVYISTLTLTSIAIDRFFVIIYPFHPRMKLSTCLAIVISIWIFALLVTIPYGMNMKIGLFHDKLICEEDWEYETTRKLFGTITSTLQFLLPFLIITLCYVCVSVRLNERARARPGNKTSRREEADRDRKRRTNRMLISMVSIFGISWLPLNLVNIFNDYNSELNDWPYCNFIFFLSHLIAMSSTCYNPFLYAWLNENFRKEFKQVLPCFQSSGSRSAVVVGTRGWRSERTWNGNNETVQETLLPTVEIQSRGGGAQENVVVAASRNSTPIDSILLADIKHQVPRTQSQETTVLPSTILETPFDGPLVLIPPQYMNNNNNNNFNCNDNNNNNSSSSNNNNANNN